MLNKTKIVFVEVDVPALIVQFVDYELNPLRPVKSYRVILSFAS